jgi:hypothetical protein
VNGIPTQRRVKIVVGPTGSGKTRWARNYLRDKSRILIADADFKELEGVEFTPPAGPGFEALCAYLEKYQSKSSFFRARYTPYESEYPLMCDLARVLGPVDFVIEECDRFPDPKYCQEYEEIIARGRHWGISITALSRHPTAIPIMLRRETSSPGGSIIAFRHNEPADIEWFRAVMGNAADEIQNLKQHEFIEWTPDGGASKPQILSFEQLK